MTAVDSSVVVAAFASWHEAHRTAVAALARRPRIAAHTLLESYSVLTRLPPPHRAAAGIVVTFLRTEFTTPPLTLPGRQHLVLLDTLANAGVPGGAAYDALIGATARHAGATLLTRDRRAAGIYERIGVRFELVD